MLFTRKITSSSRAPFFVYYGKTERCITATYWTVVGTAGRRNKILGVFRLVSSFIHDSSCAIHNNVDAIMNFVNFISVELKDIKHLIMISNFSFSVLSCSIFWMFVFAEDISMKCTRLESLFYPALIERPLIKHNRAEQIKQNNF